MRRYGQRPLVFNFGVVWQEHQLCKASAFHNNFYREIAVAGEFE